MNLTTEDIRLLRELIEWRRANGWEFTHCGIRDTYWFLKGTWRVFVYDEQYEGNEYIVLRVDDRQRKVGLSVTWPRNVREAVDVLCALSVLPVRFSSLYWVGQGAAAVAVAVDAGTTAAAVERARRLAREASERAAKVADAVAGWALAEREVAS